jgi:hypothetical protein
MRNEHDRPNSRRRSTDRTTPLHVWRCRHRPEILQFLVDHTKDLSWSRRLITLLLEELHVSDDFDNVVSSIDVSTSEQYPRLVAIALLLRHSWYPDDLDNAALWLGLPSPVTHQPALASSPGSASADIAVGSKTDTPLTPPASTPRKGDVSC